MRILRFFLVILLLASAPAHAQEEGEGFLTRQIQNALSGAGRDVDIVGFRGALSSAASFDSMTIADDEGIWLRLEDVVLQWNRSALLRGRLEVEELSAARIDIPRLPKGEEDALPAAEAEPFALPQLPDLPVSIDIRAIEIAEANLGAPLVGQAVQLSLTARAQLNDEGLDAAFQAQRTDGKEGRFELTATLGRADQVLDLDLVAREAPDGIAANLMNIPDKPSVALTVDAAGPLDDLVTQLSVDTDGAPRLSGQITLQSDGQGAAVDRRIVANIGGDITAVVLPEYRDFFGTDVSLQADTLIRSSGAIDVTGLSLQAAAVDLVGDIRLSDQRWPSFIDIEGTIARADGDPVLLPGGGGDTTLRRVALNVDYDIDNGDAYEAVFDIADLVTTAGRIAQTSLRSTGTMTGADGGVGQLRGTVNFGATGVALIDAALAQAVGERIDGVAEINYLVDQPFRITNLDLTGEDYALQGNVALSGVGVGLETTLDARLTADDLSRFSALAGRELDGATALSLEGTVTPLSGAFDLRAEGTADDIRTGIAQADALLAGRTALSLAAIRNENGTFVRDLELNNPALRFTGTAELATASSSVTLDLLLRDIATVAPQYEGEVRLQGTANQNAEGWRVDVDGNGPYDTRLNVEGLATGPNADVTFAANVPELNRFSDAVEGPLMASGSLRQTPEGFLLQTDARGPFDATARINGLVTPSVNVAFDLALPETARVAPQAQGPLRATGRLRQTAEGFAIETDLDAPFDVAARVEGDLTPALDIGFDLSMPNVGAVAPQVNGALNATGRVRQTERGFFIDTDARGPYGLRALVEGLATGPDMSLTYDVSLPNVAPLAPGINGPFAATGTLNQTPQGIRVDTNATGPYSSRVSARGVVTGPQAAVDFTLAMPNIGRLVENVNGPLNVDGSARKAGAGWQLNTAVQGPSGTRANVSGLVAEGGTLDLDIAGSAPLGLLGPFIAPRNLQGLANFDLAVNGPPALGSVSGTIRASGATLTAPTLRIALEGVNADVRLANSRAALDISGTGTGGGGVTVSGGIGLGAGLPADLAIGLQGLVLQDPRLYRTSLSGGINLNGPLTGANRGRITGEINVGETSVSVPSTGLTSIGDIPPIDHIGAPADNRATRARAGLLDGSAASDPTERASGPGYGLGILVNAPGRIFVRGRGLDAELGGSLRLTGSTANIISSGRFELLRGRLDILGKRFDLVEGYAQFQGDFVPFIRFVSTTSTETGEVSVIVQGPADAPEVTFESNPAAPQDEVLAQLLFGRNIAEISAFQALQLANAVATLAGRGGTGVVGNLRNRFGLDDLDVTTTDSGETALRVGKYLTDNIYTDVTAASDGTGEVSLNLDITPNLKGKATLGSDGNSSLGIFFERDY